MFPLLANWSSESPSSPGPPLATDLEKWNCAHGEKDKTYMRVRQAKKDPPSNIPPNKYYVVCINNKMFECDLLFVGLLTWSGARAGKGWKASLPSVVVAPSDSCSNGVCVCVCVCLGVCSPALSVVMVCVLVCVCLEVCLRVLGRVRVGVYVLLVRMHVRVLIALRACACPRVG